MAKRPAAEEPELLPSRWIVERTFAGPGRWRRLSQDSGGTTARSEALIRRAMIGLMRRRLVKTLSKR